MRQAQVKFQLAVMQYKHVVHLAMDQFRIGPGQHSQNYHKDWMVWKIIKLYISLYGGTKFLI